MHGLAMHGATSVLQPHSLASCRNQHAGSRLAEDDDCLAKTDTRFGGFLCRRHVMRIYNPVSPVGGGMASWLCDEGMNGYLAMLQVRGVL